jgi:hypothetical protein
MRRWAAWSAQASPRSGREQALGNCRSPCRMLPCRPQAPCHLAAAADAELSEDLGQARHSELCSTCTSSRISSTGTGTVIAAKALPSRGTTEPGTELAGEASASNTGRGHWPHRIQRPGHGAEQALRVVVLLIHRHPRHGLAAALRPTAPAASSSRNPPEPQPTRSDGRPPAPAGQSAKSGGPTQAASRECAACRPEHRTPA